MTLRLGLVVLGTLVGMAIAACGGDDDETSGTGGQAPTTSSAGGTGGTATTTTTSSAGGAVSALDCDPDNKCRSDEPCACQDCWFRESCNSNTCNADGVCDDDESCACADCTADPECSGYCINCQTYTAYFAGRDALCANAAPLFDALESCACDGASACLGDCQANFCQGLSPNPSCQECIEDNCAAPRDACFADTARFVQCNPVTQEGCNPAQSNERCDYVTVPAGPAVAFSPRTVIGFNCQLETNDADQCTACNYSFGSTTKCEKGNTCISAVDASVVNEGVCGRYCCDDADCGTGTCQKGAFAPAAGDLGTCTVGATSTDPGCDAPGFGASTSMGSCVTTP
ncbi:MAG: hypothetical protein AAGN82_32025 [Myxococcota bacterium]